MRRALAVLNALGDHAGEYAPLIVGAAGEKGKAVRDQVLFAALALVFATSSTVSLWTIGLVLAWNTPWRLTYLVATAALFATLAIVCAHIGNQRGQPGPVSRTLRDEFNKDMRMFQQWKRTS
jgi:uncharacterized membrane protein YqjE